MKAIVQDRYGPADVLALRDTQRPAAGPGRVLVEVRAAGVDPGVWIFMTGRPYLVRMAIGLRRPAPAVRGRDLAGVVAAVGAGVTGFEPGDEVYGCGESGSYAEFAVARADRLAPKPANLTFVQAAAVPVSAMTALRAVRDAGEVHEGQRVLVIGAGGGVGSFAVQLAKARGAHVTGVCSGAKAALVRGLGADDVVDHTRERFDRGPTRYDVIIETAGDHALTALRRALTPRGTLAIVGGSYDRGGLLGGFSRQMFRAPLVSLFVGQRLRTVSAREDAADLRELTALIEAGAVTPAVERTYPLADTPAALRALTAARRPAGKLVVTL
ncbi:NAD(P)-dependent alcohol dehydrogenase [Dactylosporangium sp. NPDC005572]|uniref:NAD(P)-dependent alcohol dehydrogenase n=1 Tax=Dactylosporangium sp. NPDC005572 TaxID=3156889 RepID=UPI0033B548F2